MSSSQLRSWVDTMRLAYLTPTPETILEVGSYNVNGGVRDLFVGYEQYIGIDIESGPDVDIVMNAHDIDIYYDYNTFDLILCLEMLEHDNDPFITIENMHTLLKSDGYLIISSPANGFPEHRYPRDYWRFLPDTYYDIFFKGFHLLELTELDHDGNPGLACIGRKL